MLSFLYICFYVSLAIYNLNYIIVLKFPLMYISKFYSKFCFSATFLPFYFYYSRMECQNKHNGSLRKFGFNSEEGQSASLAVNI